MPTQKWTLRFCFLFVTLGCAYGQPFIAYRGVVNAASYMAPGLPGGAIAQGSAFTIFGRQLGPTPSPALAFPLATTLGGVSITITSGSAAVNAIPIYVSPTQINAILPSNTPLGAASVRVTYNNAASNPVPIRVAASSFGIFSVSGAGLGPGILQNFVAQNQQPINSLQQAAQPGQTLTLWGTGLGAVAFPDNVPPTAGNLPVRTEVFVGGQSAAVTYNGRSPCCAGIDQVVLQLPSNVPLGCWVPVYVRTAGTNVSNFVTIAISKDGSPCSDPANSLASALVSGGKIGAFAAARFTIHNDVGVLKAGDATTDVIGGYLAQEKNAAFNFNPMFSLPPAGSCTAYAVAGNFPADVAVLPGVAPTGRYLDAGTITLSGSKVGSSLIAPPILGGLAVQYLGGALTSLPLPNHLFLNPGQFTISAPGGADIDAFQATFAAPQALSSANLNQISTIDRTQPLTLTWTGGLAGNIVFAAGWGVDLPGNATDFFLCTANAADGSLTVPPAVLANIPPTRPLATQSLDGVYLGQWSIGNPITFSATGLDFGVITAVAAGGKTVSFQ
jgi:uncharacterized protein (TIGR03437 family)